MEAHVITRRLTVILHADVQGYSRRIEADEVATLRILTPYLHLMTELVRQHGGYPIGSRGDSLLAEFPSARSAVQCAVAMQRELHARNAALPAEQRIEFRMGIHVGEVVEDGEQLHGDGINIAVRIESVAEAGGILISGSVYDQVKNKLPFQYEDLGPQHLKNIAESVRVYRVVLEGQTPRASRTEKRFWFVPPGKSPWRKAIGAGIALLLLVAGIGTLWYQSASLSPAPRSTTPPQADKALPLPDKPSIVVLPFDNMSKDPEQDYFSDGITEVLTSDLSRISSLFVIARNTAFTYKGKPVNTQAVGRELGVRYVMEGSVQKAGEHVRIVAQVIDTTTGGHIWSERYDRPLKDIFALQDEIVQRIVTTLRLQLTLLEHGYLVRKTTDNLEAYDYFLRGLGYQVRLTKEANAQARQMFEKALALDPRYVAAYVELSSSYFLEWIWGWNADPQNLARAFELAQQALALDDSLPVAHSLLSYFYALQQQYDQAIAEGEQTIALAPNHADSYAIQAEVLNFAGRPEEALRLMEQAMRLNPHYPATYLVRLGWAYRLTGRYAEAQTVLKEAISRNPNFMSAYFLLAINYVAQWVFQQGADTQTLAQALTAARRAVALSDSFWANHWVLGYVYLCHKQYDQALAEMERAVTLAPNFADGSASLAEMLGWVGRSEEALKAVEQALHRTPFSPDGHLLSVGAAYYLAGRPEEAIAPLKQYLTRYPNILGAHLILAAAYSEVGEEAEAQAEAAEVLRVNPQFSLEVHQQRVPIKDPAVLERSLAALRKAGLT